MKEGGGGGREVDRVRKETEKQCSERHLNVRASLSSSPPLLLSSPPPTPPHLDQETQQVHPDVNPPQRGTLSLMKGAADTSHRLTVCSLGCGAWLRRMEQRAAHLQGRRVITHVQTQNRH